MVDNPHLDSDLTRKPIKNKLGMRFFGYKSKNELSSENVTDGLTGLLNRKGWDQKTSEYLRHSERTREKISFIVIDLDEFKAVNDSQGHEAGDKVLVEFSKKLKQIARTTDILARHGGDEFTLCLPATSVEEAQVVKQRILKESGDIKFSVGVGSDFRTADIGMYRMKQDNKNGR